ncbi:seryl-tRNA synthetase [Coccidioides immitis H538.4]|uniref:Seryl-tRNA synthetase n=1 Tax=Coccidioides immitis H538.4 TaxID=396776 RepID=A0A0J8RCK2_COCIT|nr:seryl-tRNA synthetase [Coccidioides immitis H538.4]
MLDIADLIADRGGDPKKVKESQRRRFASEELVDEVISLYEDARRTRYEASQIGSKINALQKEIGMKKKNKEDASELLAQKAKLEQDKKAQEDLAVEKEKLRDRKLKTIGNYVHDSVPISNNEVPNICGSPPPIRHSLIQSDSRIRFAIG